MFFEPHAKAEPMREKIQIAKLSPFLFAVFCPLCGALDFRDSETSAASLAKEHAHLQISDDTPVPFEFAGV